MKKTLSERLDNVEKLFVKIYSEKEKLEHPKACIFCVFSNKEKESIIPISNSAWLISCDLVKKYCRKKGFTTCDHNNGWLVNESVTLTYNISNLLQAKSNNRYNSLELFKVLGDYLDKDNAPKNLQKIINTVGKKWIKSLNPFDYDFGYLDLVKEHGEGIWEGKMVPPHHPNIYRTAKEWAKVCECDECQSYWVIKNKEIKEAEKSLIKH